MLRYALMAVGAAMVVAVVFVLLPTGGGPRQEPHMINGGDTPPILGGHDAAPVASVPAPPAKPGSNFVVHDAAPPDPSAAPVPPPDDLDAVMQRLRAAAPTVSPGVDATAAAPPVAAVPSAPPPPHWTSVTGQGTRWRMSRTSNGFNVAIDLGGGQVAEVHVLPAFGVLDVASTNLRIDYLRQTILQNFSSRSATYNFARDGSVAVAP